FQLIALVAFVTCANAGFIGSPTLSYAATPAIHAVHAAPVAYAAAPLAKAVIAKTIDTEYDPHPQYSYAYDVADSLTGDSKSQQETRDGDVVSGSYSLLEADGTRRVVHYTADDHNGFNAVVEKQPAAIAYKTVATAPVLKTVAPYPLSYAASSPLIKAVAPAPAVTYSSPVVNTYAAAPTLAYSAPLLKSYAAPSPVVKTLAPLPYPSPYTHSYATQYSQSFSAPVVTKYAAAPTLAYSSPVAYNAAIPVAHSSVPAVYAAAHEYASKW
ncbi:PREDICTED: cuticle protein-like, partial [Ceratosolen solmsi marchali]|uniref:Cuticle protein-like n=1 Tax=Ceratosolen solmsi marchali TaxID=326594 RepID=A0AAJ6YGL1_9HYME